MILLSFMASNFLLARAAIVRAVSNGIRDTRFCVLLAFALCPWATSSLFAAVSRFIFFQISDEQIKVFLEGWLGTLIKKKFA